MTREYRALDGCRGLAACLVALFHFRAVMSITVNSHVANVAIVRNAWLAVDFFFVLSGFVIAANYQDRLIAGSVRVRDFLLLRLGRLYPLHLVTLLAMLVIITYFRLSPPGPTRPVIPAGEMSAVSFVADLFLVQGLNTLGQLTWNHPSWSVSAELATYVVFAFSWRVLRRFTWILIGATIVIVPPLLLVLHGSLNVSYDWGFPRSMLGFSLGVLAFNVMRTSAAADLFARLTSMEASIAEFTLLIVAIMLVSLAGETPISIASPFLFAGVVLLYSQEKGIVTRALMARSAQAAGRWSYSIYMIHFPLQTALVYAALWSAVHGVPGLFMLVHDGSATVTMLGRTPWIGDVENILMMCVLLAISAASYRFIEKPWRDRVRAKVYSAR